jgi:hypothetical protein
VVTPPTDAATVAFIADGHVQRGGFELAYWWRSSADPCSETVINGTVTTVTTEVNSHAEALDGADVTVWDTTSVVRTSETEPGKPSSKTVTKTIVDLIPVPKLVSAADASPTDGDPSLSVPTQGGGRGGIGASSSGDDDPGSRPKKPQETTTTTTTFTTTVTTTVAATTRALAAQHNTTSMTALLSPTGPSRTEVSKRSASYFARQQQSAAASTHTYLPSACERWRIATPPTSSGFVALKFRTYDATDDADALWVGPCPGQPTTGRGTQWPDVVARAAGRNAGPRIGKWLAFQAYGGNSNSNSNSNNNGAPLETCVEWVSNSQLSRGKGWVLEVSTDPVDVAAARHGAGQGAGFGSGDLCGRGVRGPTEADHAVVLRETEGVYTSPQPYDPNSCLEIVIQPNATAVGGNLTGVGTWVLAFDYGETESGPGDTIAVYAGTSVRRGQVLSAPRSGPRAAPTTALFPATNAVTVLFRSDAADQARGFSFSWRVLPAAIPGTPVPTAADATFATGAAVQVVDPTTADLTPGEPVTFAVSVPAVIAGPGLNLRVAVYATIAGVAQSPHFSTTGDLTALAAAFADPAAAAYVATTGGPCGDAHATAVLSDPASPSVALDTAVSEIFSIPCVDRAPTVAITAPGATFSAGSTGIVVTATVADPDAAAHSQEEATAFDIRVTSGRVSFANTALAAAVIVSEPVDGSGSSVLAGSLIGYGRTADVAALLIAGLKVTLPTSHCFAPSVPVNLTVTVADASTEVPASAASIGSSSAVLGATTSLKLIASCASAAIVGPLSLTASPPYAMHVPPAFASAAPGTDRGTHALDVFVTAGRPAVNLTIGSTVEVEDPAGLPLIVRCTAAASGAAAGSWLRATVITGQSDVDDDAGSAATPVTVTEAGFEVVIPSSSTPAVVALSEVPGTAAGVPVVDIDCAVVSHTGGLWDLAVAGRKFRASVALQHASIEIGSFGSGHAATAAAALEPVRLLRAIGAAAKLNVSVSPAPRGGPASIRCSATGGAGAVFVVPINAFTIPDGSSAPREITLGASASSALGDVNITCVVASDGGGFHVGISTTILARVSNPAVLASARPAVAGTTPVIEIGDAIKVTAELAARPLGTDLAVTVSCVSVNPAIATLRNATASGAVQATFAGHMWNGNSQVPRLEATADAVNVGNATFRCTVSAAQDGSGYTAGQHVVVTNEGTVVIVPVSGSTPPPLPSAAPSLTPTPTPTPSSTPTPTPSATATPTPSQTPAPSQAPPTPAPSSFSITSFVLAPDGCASSGTSLRITLSGKLVLVLFCFLFLFFCFFEMILTINM